MSVNILPIQDGYDTTLTSALDSATGAGGYINVAAAPSATLPVGKTTTVRLDTGNTRAEEIEIDEIDVANKRLRIKTRNMTQGNGLTTSAQTHPAGASCIITFSYAQYSQLFNELAAYNGPLATYADEAARDAANPSPTNGQICYVTGTGAVQIRVGGNWENVATGDDEATTRQCTTAEALNGELFRDTGAFNNLKYKSNAGVVYTLLIDSTGKLDSSVYDFASQDEAEAGSNTAKPMNALRTAQAISSLSGIGVTAGETVAAGDMLYVNPGLPQVSKVGTVTSATGATAFGGTAGAYCERAQADMVYVVGGISGTNTYLRSYQISGSSISASTERSATDVASTGALTQVCVDSAGLAVVVKHRDGAGGGIGIYAATVSGTTLSALGSILAIATATTNNAGIACIGTNKFFAFSGNSAASRLCEVYTVTASGTALTLANTTAVATAQISNARCWRVADDIGLITYTVGGGNKARAITWSGTTPTIGSEVSLSGNSICSGYLPTSTTTGYLLMGTNNFIKVSRSGTTLTAGSGIAITPPTGKSVTQAYGYSDGVSKAKYAIITGTDEVTLGNFLFSGTDLIQDSAVDNAVTTVTSVNSAIRAAYVGTDAFAGMASTTANQWAQGSTALHRLGTARAAASASASVVAQANAVLAIGYSSLVPGARYDVTTTPPTLSPAKTEGRGAAVAVSTTAMILY